MERTSRRAEGGDAPRAAGEVEPRRRRRRLSPVLGRLLLLVLAAVSLYVLAPQLLAVFSAWPQLRHFRPLWYPVMLALEAGSFVCTWELLRIAVPGTGWLVASTSQLVSNAVSRVVPGGMAVGGATQFRMLTVAGVDPARAGSALTATSLITTGTVFALPVLAVPTLLFGRPVPAALAQAAAYGALLFVVLAAVGIVLGRWDTPLRALARLLCRLARLLRRRPRSDLPDLIVDRRDEVVSALGRRWPTAVLAAAGRSGLDYFALLAAVAGAGVPGRPSVVLLAYVAATVLGMIPITPGGLGFVEAGLTGTLALAGLPAAQATLATLAYRLASFWLPMLAGLPAWIAFRRRHGVA